MNNAKEPGRIENTTPSSLLQQGFTKYQTVLLFCMCLEVYIYYFSSTH